MKVNHTGTQKKRKITKKFNGGFKNRVPFPPVKNAQCK